MPVVTPARYTPVPKRPRKRRPFLRIVVALALIASIVNYVRPLPTPTATLSLYIPAAVAASPISWPGGGEAAIAANGYGLLDTYNTQTPIATASIAKVITALCVLQKQPLNLGQAGPTYTITAADMAIYQNYVDQDGSLVDVEQGEHLTEYQALEALMIPSANNIADSLVRWVFGGQVNYAAYATAYLQRQGLNQTHIGSDASGFAPDTTSTASDLTSLGLLALKNPVLMEIAGKESTELPVAGMVTNYDTVLGTHGITGLKTGNNDADPGAFLFTATRSIGSRTVDFTGAVMGAPDLNTALQTAQQLSDSMRQNFTEAHIASAQQAVGSLQTAWGGKTDIITSSDVALVHWKSTPLTETHKLNPNVHSGTVGSLKVASGQAHASTNLELKHAISGPSFWWRLTRL